MKNKITLYMESTKKEPEETIYEINMLLKQFGVRDVLVNYDDEQNVSSFSFSINSKNGILAFKLPVNHKPLWKLSKERKTRYINCEQQARRVAWRQIYRWIQSQVALIQVDMVSVEEIFLPYLMMDNKNTLYEKLTTSDFNFKLLGE